MWPWRRTFEIALPGHDPYFIRKFERKRSFYEADVLLHLAHRGPRGGLFLDVGAHVGNHTLFFASFLADHVIAIEPNPATATLLRRNVDFRRIWIGDVASMLGDWFNMIAMYTLVRELTGSPLALWSWSFLYPF